MRVGVVGCGHGELEKMYGALGRLEANGGFTVDVLLICGDFQAARNEQDLESMAVPKKYRKMCDFYKYYNGELKAPILTLVIGGNHEASAYMDELPHGGWLAPNIFFLGTAGCVRVGDLRIAGLSGIFKGGDYLRGRFESAPYDDQTVRSTYHIRALDVLRLMSLYDEERPIDIMLSHDWPQGIWKFGNENWLRKKKPFFCEDMDSGKLGSPPTRKLLDHIRPRYWFAAHLHVGFAALVPHNCGKTTRFLALDKCLPNRDFLQVLEIGGEMGPLRYDADWLCILRKTHHLGSRSPHNRYDLPKEDSKEFGVSSNERDELLDDWCSDLKVPHNFVQTAPPYERNAPPCPVIMHENPQTVELCKKLGFVFNLGDLKQGPTVTLDGVLGSAADSSELSSFCSDSVCNSTFETTLDQTSESDNSFSLSNRSFTDGASLSYATTETPSPVTESTSSRETKKHPSPSKTTSPGGFQLKRRNASIYDSQPHEDPQ